MGHYKKILDLQRSAFKKLAFHEFRHSQSQKALMDNANILRFKHNSTDAHKVRMDGYHFPRCSGASAGADGGNTNYYSKDSYGIWFSPSESLFSRDDKRAILFVGGTIAMIGGLYYGMYYVLYGNGKYCLPQMRHSGKIEEGMMSTENVKKYGEYNIK